MSEEKTFYKYTIVLRSRAGGLLKQEVTAHRHEVVIAIGAEIESITLFRDEEEIGRFTQVAAWSRTPVFLDDEIDKLLGEC